MNRSTPTTWKMLFSKLKGKKGPSLSPERQELCMNSGLVVHRKPNKNVGYKFRHCSGRFN